MHRNVIETVLGGVVILVAAMFLIFTLQFSNAGVKGYDLYGDFRHVDGVKVGDEVRLAGVKVGTVTALNLKPQDFSAIVTMRLQPEVQISADSTLSIHTDGLLGGKYLEILIGGDTNNLKPGGHFGFVQDAVIVEELIEKIVAFAEGQRKKTETDPTKAKKK
jgi:phospholipid/cholesterol/gamma-HCH transport system substrate-binding protein